MFYRGCSWNVVCQANRSGRARNGSYGELWTSSVWHDVETSMMPVAEAEFSRLWR